ncbi:DUF4179 domain-containing protein [Sporosarcina sp. 6E9]|uniref:DUF4179 domain-containing protein n=1 Tax=Sporosarcina sp. 6E9 TaxID=2819235 RepID=UPI001B310015
MFRKEEAKLEKWKNDIEQIKVADDLLEDAIKKGFQRAQNTRPVKRQRLYVKRGIWSIVVAAILFLTLVTSIRVSPVMANAVASIPGMEKFVEFIRDDKGLASAIENEYYQELNISTEKDGVTLTLDGVLADEFEMVLFYTIKGAGKNEQFQLSKSDVTDNQGRNFRMTLGSETNLDADAKGSDQTAKITIRFKEDITLNEHEFIFKTTAESEQRSVDFSIPFAVDKVRAPTTRYSLNETFLIDGQKIIVKQIEVSPLKVAIHISEDPANTKKVFGFEDLRLVDEKGETWTSINNGVTKSGTENENANIYYLQSNYFEEPNSLYLQFNKLMAMDKEEAFILIDTDNEEILQQPKDNRFSKLTVNGRFINIELRGEEGYHYHPFSTITDASGKEFVIISSGFSHNSHEHIELSLELPDDVFENPIKLNLDGYPTYIEGKAKIKIK